MNRRNAIRAAIAGLAAVVGWKSVKWRICVPGPITIDGATATREPVSYVEGNGCPPPRGIIARKCWECERQTTEVVCHHCGFDSGPQPDGGLLVPARFNAYMEQLRNANRA